MHEIPTPPLAVPHITVRIFVQRRAIILCQRIIVHRKMHRHKIQNDSNPVLMQQIHHPFQFIRRTISRRRAVKSGLLISPGLVTGMLPQRHHLHIVITVFLQIGNQFLRQLVIAIPILCLRPFFLPGSHMQFIDIKRSVFTAAPLFHPFPVMKSIAAHIPDDTGIMGPQLHPKPIGVAMVDVRTVPPIDPVFIHRSRTGLRNMAFPEIPVMYPLHGRFLPAIPFPDHRDPLCSWCKSPKYRPVRPQPAAQVLISIENLSRIKSIQIHNNLPITRQTQECFNNSPARVPHGLLAKTVCSDSGIAFN